MRTRALLVCVLLATACGATTRPDAQSAPRTTRPGVQTVASSTRSVATLGDGKTHSAAEAAKLADAGLDLITFPAGSTRLATRPALGSADLDPYSVITSQVRRMRWWSVPGAAADAVAFFIANPAAGLTVSQPTPNGLSWAGFPWFPVTAVLAQDGDHVIVSMGAEVTWTPAKTAIETIPASVRTATFDYDQGYNTTGHDSRRVIAGAALDRLRDAINVNVPGWEGERLCPADDGGNATLTMRYGGHDMVFVIALTGCSFIGVTSDGKAQPGLDCCDRTTAGTDAGSLVADLAQAPSAPATKANPVPRQLVAVGTSVPAALAQDKALLASLQLPAGVVREKPPKGLPADSRDPNQHLVESSMWFTLPLARAAAMAWLTTHLPRGFAMAHIGRDAYGYTPLIEQPVGIYPSAVDLAFFLYGKGATTQVQITARKFYLPSRTAAETIPLTTRTAQLSVQLGSGVTHRVQYSGARLTQLIRALNARPAQWYELPSSCTKTGPNSKLGVLFHVGKHSINFYWYGYSCDMIVVVDGKNAPYLAGPPTALVERLVKRANS